jgi:S-adenosylmethionine:tRNA ribosyltransferase-isomerase
VRVSDFDFDLPDELIAQTAAPRGESRMLVLSRASGTLSDALVRDLPRFLHPGDLLVANDSRVFPARLLGHRVPSGGAVECLLLAREEPILGPRSSILEQTWSALVHPGQKLKPGAIVKFAPRQARGALGSSSLDWARDDPERVEGSKGESDAGVLMAEILERQFFGRRSIRLWADAGGDVDTLVDAMGHVPLPPYIHRADTPDDRERYQTVFAAERGSIAAPTAGLHFDDPLLAALDGAGVQRVAVTLHVGYGTFKPVRVEQVEDHAVDPEPYEISAAAAAAINAALDAGRRIVAIGTTTTRAIEDAAQRGSGRVRAGRARAELFIHPGFDFRVISGLMTNFHLPKSSLLMLVAAFAGRERVLRAYAEAVEHRYRFYSYGDAMLIR